MVQSTVSPVQTFLEEATAREVRRNVLLSYWCKLFPGVSYSPQEFYALVAANLEAQRVPGLETGQVTMRQSGAFSSERLYLQFRRERLVFEICGAPFGAGFFVSSRLFDRRREATLLDIILLLLLIGLCGIPVAYQFGWMWGLFAIAGIIAFLWTVMRLAATETLAWLDRTLSDLPLVGLIYERFFHPDTYYREDTNNAYREAVHGAVMQAVDEMITQRGVTPLTPEEKRPSICELHRR